MTAWRVLRRRRSSNAVPFAGLQRWPSDRRVALTQAYANACPTPKNSCSMAHGQCLFMESRINCANRSYSQYRVVQAPPIQIVKTRARTIEDVDGLLRKAIVRANLVPRAAPDKNECTEVIDGFVTVQDTGYSLLPIAQQAPSR
jgi:hypothetical protein